MERTCSVCKGTGQMKYKDISVLADRSWIPWKTKDCTFCHGSAVETSPAMLEFYARNESAPENPLTL